MNTVQVFVCAYTLKKKKKMHIQFMIELNRDKIDLQFRQKYIKFTWLECDTIWQEEKKKTTIIINAKALLVQIVSKPCVSVSGDERPTRNNSKQSMR